MANLTLRLRVEAMPFLAAAFAFLVFMFVPEAAVAHAGHTHSASSTTDSRAADASVPSHDFAIAIVTQAEATAARAESQVGFNCDVPLYSGGAGENRSCDGTCCAANCVACCALLPEDRFAGSLICTRDRPALSAALAADSLDPDALGRPPKRFA